MIGRLGSGARDGMVPWVAVAASVALHGGLAATALHLESGPATRVPKGMSLVIDVIMPSARDATVDRAIAAESAPGANSEGPASALDALPLEAGSPEPPKGKSVPAIPEHRDTADAVALDPPPLATRSPMIPPPSRKPPPPDRRPPPPIATAETSAPPGSAAEPAGASANPVASPHRETADAQGSGTSSGGGARVAAGYRLGSVHAPKPRYPRLARLRGWEGRVVLSVSVDAKGRPTSVRIRASSGFDILDQAAARTVRTWRFEPARLAGDPVADALDVAIRFELAEG